MLQELNQELVLKNKNKKQLTILFVVDILNEARMFDKERNCANHPTPTADHTGERVVSDSIGIPTKGGIAASEFTPGTGGAAA